MLHLSKEGKTLVELSGHLLFISFICYLIAVGFFGGAIRSPSSSHLPSTYNRPGTIAMFITLFGFFAQLGYFITRWIASDHAPLSNLFEFMTFFGMMLVGAFILLFMIYRTAVLGLFTLPIALLIIAYANMFPKDINPLVPSLRSYWLQIHVTTAAIGEAILSISFAASLIYLIKTIDQTKRNKQTWWMEFVMFCLICIVGFIACSTVFALTGYTSTFKWIDKHGIEQKGDHVLVYHLPAVIAPHQGELVTAAPFKPVIAVSPYINANKLNTVICSIISGMIIYWFIRLIARKRIGALLKPLTKHIHADLIDEISYRSVLIGFPIFTLGALIFAMIWAQIAWTKYWSWDPKEDWALITWLFYAVFLHLRLSRGWQGEKSAWLGVIGFAIIMFNLMIVNLVIVGLHSYA